MNKLLGSTEEHEFSIGLNKIVDFVKTNSYSVLCLGDCELSEYKNAVMDAARHFTNTIDVSEASRSIVHLSTEKSITMTELANSIGGLSGVLGSGTMQIEYGLSANSKTVTTAIIMATGFSETKFDKYDPVDEALKGKAWNMESDFDNCILQESFLLALESV